MSSKIIYEPDEGAILVAQIYSVKLDSLIYPH